MNLLMLKLSVAVLALCGVAVMAGHDLLPAWSTPRLMGAAVLLALCVLATLALLAWLTGTLAQALLRRGARDAAWGWFSEDPPGLGDRRKH
ncbi:hypothetical protein KAK07_15610 [Ideonella sp. 4Y16]|uniref:Uncharacterized protein n=1 Tax=Ideonella alba TaxID=2824118 RepID=A0A941BDZ0_9BURK|nr:hypothetical protein [Ideonella alba]MBQ0930646.1 hypothetical protein [Ideonella alba]MBQ0944766.1 hypothetical protein [Ideonella alba]